MKRLIIVGVGSENSLKIDAVRQACELLEIDADEIRECPAPSGQNAQPVGFEEMYAGAYVRARHGMERFPNAMMAIGIENGIIRLPFPKSLTIDFAVIVVRCRNNRILIGTTPGIELPELCVREAEQRGFANHTVGEVIAEQMGGDQADPHAILTHGASHRRQVLIDGLRVVLAQIS